MGYMMEHLPELHLLIAGDDSTPYGRRVHQHVENSRSKNRIRLLGTVTDAERQWLYQNCQAFVFPSLAEGFGLPVLEAMNAGKPTVLAHRTMNTRHSYPGGANGTKGISFRHRHSDRIGRG